jgi:hypothetical protein
VYAVLQHTPSAQKPLVHSAPTTLGAPLARLPMHVLPTHVVLPVQSALVAQDVWHTLGPQTYGAHVVVVWTQEPLPLQAPGLVWAPPEQPAAVPQGVALGQW